MEALGRINIRGLYPPSNAIIYMHLQLHMHLHAHNQICVLNDDFLVFADCTSTTGGHCYKLYKGYSQVNTHKYFFTNRICDIWNALPSSVVEASSLTVFKRLLDHVDLTRYCVDIR